MGGKFFSFSMLLGNTISTDDVFIILVITVLLMMVKKIINTTLSDY